MNNTPTPETDAVIASDMGDSKHLSDMECLCRGLEIERYQLRRVCDELAAVVRGEFGNYNWRVSAYNKLPHVLERKTK